MSRERAKILQMVADKAITPDEAEKLLARLESSGSAAPDAGVDEDPGERRSGPIKYLRVVVDGPDKVNVRIPIGLIRTGIKLSALMPRSASRQLSEHGIDLARFSELDDEELRDALRTLSVDIDRDDGEVVRVFCE